MWGSSGADTITTLNMQSIDPVVYIAHALRTWAWAIFHDLLITSCGGLHELQSLGLGPVGHVWPLPYSNKMWGIANKSIYLPPHAPTPINSALSWAQRE